ncbi:MAG: hydrogenase [Deltaproteobacteria bacterium]|nr:hydrogenase [Deltaproteobacteria bacterium]MBI2499996.1 hydrogenase [Deltaproteobacteria bacterium]MBI4196836.1 hydrogenase [Deltaproteobacteria bacterium]
MNWILIGVLLSAFFILGISRLSACIRAVAFQGALLSVLPIFVKGWNDPHALFLFGGTLIIKAMVIPSLLFRSIREATIREEAEPIVSLHLSLLGGGGIMVAAFSSLNALPHLAPPFSPLFIPAALSIVLIGLFLLISRTKAISQVIGFLVLDNGIFLFGMTLVAEFPMTVELGVLLDLLVGVFVMGIMIYHINRTFDHIDTGALATLRDTE